jgi:mycothiol synthase
MALVSHAPIEIGRVADLVYARPAQEIHLADLPYRLSAPSAWSMEDSRMWEVDGRIIGYAVVQQAWGTVDFAVEPGYEECVLEPMATWFLRRMQELTTARQERLDWWIESRADLTARTEFAIRLDFSADSWHLVQYDRPLSNLPTSPVLPTGYSIRELGSDSAAAAALQRTAFATDNMTDAWRARVLQVHGYRPDLDLTVIAPDGGLAAFCLAWLDPSGSHGQIEPTGTHPDHQRLGLGRALLQESFRRLTRCGARTVGAKPSPPTPARSRSTKHPGSARSTPSPSTPCRASHDHISP